MDAMILSGRGQLLLTAIVSPAQQQLSPGTGTMAVATRQSLLLSSSIVNTTTSSDAQAHTQERFEEELKAAAAVGSILTGAESASIRP